MGRVEQQVVPGVEILDTARLPPVDGGQRGGWRAGEKSEEVGSKTRNSQGRAAGPRLGQEENKARLTRAPAGHGARAPGSNLRAVLSVGRFWTGHDRACIYMR